MASKQVSHQQSTQFGTRMLKNKELHRVVMQMFNDTNNLPAVACAFTGQHQVICAALENDNDNNYLNEHGGMRFGIEQTFIPAEDSKIMAVVPMQEEGDSVAERHLTDQWRQGMK